MPTLYRLKKDTATTEAVKEAQLKFHPVFKDSDKINYLLDEELANHVAISPIDLPEYTTLKVGLTLSSEFDGKVFYMAYGIPGGKVTIAPVVDVNLLDTQFDDDNEEVSVARTLMSALFSMSSLGLDIAPDHDNAFTVHDDSTFVFPLKLKVEGVSTKVNLPVLDQCGPHIGNVTLEEIIDDVETYDELSMQIARSV